MYMFIFRDGMPQRSVLPLCVVIPLAVDDANLRWDQRTLVRVLDASHAGCQ